VTMFEKLQVPVYGIVENMSQFICPECGHREAIFSVDGGKQFAEEIGSSFLGAIPLEPAIRVGGDSGSPVVISQPASASALAFSSIAEAVAQRASIVAFQRSLNS
ncbi:MAG: Mrp/NBP35 family ATP-binding protein, partial [Sphaerospermopsis sp. SIO1G2]|nr:Mrp/NBP35 family ATP-binding protein [Sphaerospermopsis sp. SIO1G2]